MANKRNRFFLSTKKNFIAGIQFPYCMMDSGCSSHLLPIDDEIYELILQKFVNDFYRWEIKQGKGVAAFNSPILTIKPIDGSNIKVKLNFYEKLYFETVIPNLRFHVSMKDAQALLTNNLVIQKISKPSQEILRIFVKQIEFMQKKFKDLLFGERRKHVLIGQDIIKHFVAIQFNKIALFLDPQHLNENISILKKIDKVINIAEDNVIREFSKNEFDNLEDEDHDSTEEYYIIEELSD